ncbi:MAG: hypothetical protein R3328_00310 [Planococcaceae bacterium]|nr:hypothetical protein [Planococcaceae bacterium]
MNYKVISAFKDADDNMTRYKVGDDYPQGSYKPTKKRIAELMEKHPKYNRVFLKEVELEEPPKKEVKKPSAKKNKSEDK